jgi:hypothetical protein
MAGPRHGQRSFRGVERAADGDGEVVDAGLHHDGELVENGRRVDPLESVETWKRLRHETALQLLRDLSLGAVELGVLVGNIFEAVDSPSARSRRLISRSAKNAAIAVRSRPSIASTHGNAARRLPPSS